MRVTFQMTLQGWYVRDPLWLIEVTTSALWNVSSLDSQCIGEEFELRRHIPMIVVSLTILLSLVYSYTDDCHISYSHLGNAIMYSPLCNAQLPNAHRGHYQSLQTLKPQTIQPLQIFRNLFLLNIPL